MFTQGVYSEVKALDEYLLPENVRIVDFPASKKRGEL